tara:strand:+ start:1899 stop:2828 length:930 start_codon:yes stop_codon:yes gene_type:complete
VSIKISVVTPNYNYSRFLKDCINSVVNQTYQPDEYIIMDDASTDESPVIIKDYENKIPYLKGIYREENKGVNYNINQGFKTAKNDYIMFLASDDIWEPTLIEEYVKSIEKNKDAGMCTCQTKVLDVETGEETLMYLPQQIPDGYLNHKQARDYIYKYGTWFCGNTVLFKRKEAIACGAYQEDLETFADGYLYLKMALKYGVITVKKPLSTLRSHINTYSSEIKRDLKKLEEIKIAALIYMRNNNDFDEVFINRWESRWKYQYFLAVIAKNTKFLPQPIRWFSERLGFIYYCWFDVKLQFLTKIKNFSTH